LGSSDLDPSQSLSGGRSWSIARRFFLTSFILIVAQSGLSLAISGKLWKDFTASHLNLALSRELLRPLNLVDNKLDSLSAQEAMECCTKKDYEYFLSDIDLEDGKAVMILGSAGLVQGEAPNRFIALNG